MYHSVGLLFSNLHIYALKSRRNRTREQKKNVPTNRCVCSHVRFYIHIYINTYKYILYALDKLIKKCLNENAKEKN